MGSAAIAAELSAFYRWSPDAVDERGWSDLLADHRELARIVKRERQRQ